MIPLPRRPLDPEAGIRHWYEKELGWPTAPGSPVRLVTGLRFDVLDVPVEAGVAALGRLAPDSPVAVRGDRMRLLVAAGSAEELPGLLEWLEWGALDLDLVALGADGSIEAPAPLEPASTGARPLPTARSGAPAVRAGSQEAALRGAAVWLRPPEPGREVESSLPTLAALGRGVDAPDLVRLVDTVATHCHRVRLRRAGAQRLASS
ncbi:SCO3374 family protein [Streptomyces sp. NPDC001843]|uniref:SCO3374 family protein n=1 Tax=Streptomyces sp. NPDC001843 TaxID=3364617 RepID=UPI0036AA7DC4